MRVLVVDDHPSVGYGTKKLLEQDKDIEVLIALSAKEAIETIKREKIDVMLLDLNMPGMSGIELTKRVIALDPLAIILIYTGYDYFPYFNTLIEAGVSGFVSKTSQWDKVVQAIRHALEGEAIIPKNLLKQLRRSHPMVVLQHEQLFKDISISSRDQAVLHEIAKGKSNKEIAEELYVSQRTIEYTLTGIFTKLGVKSRTEALNKAKQFGIIPENID